MTYEYQKYNRYFAQASETTEKLVAQELEHLGCAAVKATHRGVSFQADRETLYRANYSSRVATRILAPLLTFQCHSDRYLYKTARKIAWTELFGVDSTFAVFATVSESAIRHSRFAALRLKDAIVDTFRESLGARPSVRRIDPDVWVNLHIRANKAVISLDTSGGSLHRRGYRRQSVEAPMQETAAAALLAVSGWNGKRALYDPMCGSGTILAEALMRACRIPAGYLRTHFGFERLPDFDPVVWRDVKKKADGGMRAVAQGLIGGSDVSAKAVQAARANLAALPSGPGVQVSTRDFRRIERLDDCLIVCNPPYGVRMGTKGSVEKLYGEFGDFFRNRCGGCSAWIYFGNAKHVSSIGLKPSRRVRLWHGGLDGVAAGFDTA